jgi:hypothetical protein
LDAIAGDLLTLSNHSLAGLTIHLMTWGLLHHPPDGRWQREAD